MFEEFVKTLDQLDDQLDAIESMTARVGEWTIDISEYGGKRSIEFTRPLVKEEEEE